MNFTKEEVQQVLGAITGPIYGAPVFGEPVRAAITILQSKLAEKDDGDYVSLSNKGDAKIPLFTTPQWQPISTAPRDGTNILLLLHPEIADKCGYAIQIGHYEKRPLFGETWTAQNDGFSTEVDGATHWLPLPEKP